MFSTTTRYTNKAIYLALVAALLLVSATNTNAAATRAAAAADADDAAADNNSAAADELLLYNTPANFGSGFDKVKVELFYMPQCPGCRQLITTSFNDAFHTPGFSDMADVTFIPYGNDRQLHNGKREFDNLLEACALEKIEHQDTRFQYIDCIDHSKSARDAYNVDMECASAIGLSPTVIQQIEECASSDYGHELAHGMNVKCDSSTPRITYFPWIVVNNAHLTADIEHSVWTSLFDYVCDKYTGSDRSPSCDASDDDDDVVDDTERADDIMIEEM